MKKVFLVLVMIVSSLFAKPLNGDIDYTNDNITQNTNVEQVSVLENTIADEKIIELEQEEIIVQNADENVVIEEKKEIENKEPIVENKSPKIQNNNKSNQNETRVKEQPKVEIKTEPTPQPKEEPKPVKQPKIETKTKQEEKIYCVDGGKVHIYGDGANEHGYYKTWNEAFKAYEDYTKGWESTQFKVDQCACGLYYFWVIK